MAEAFDHFGGFDLVVIAIGVLGAQEGLDADPARAAEVMRVNFVDSGLLMLECLRRLRAQRHGALVVLSSVAAERARAGNAVYGAAKAGLDALAQGLADATAATGVRVLVVRPGFVRGRMTAGLKPTPMATTPDAVAAATVGALGTKREHDLGAGPTTLRVLAAAAPATADLPEAAAVSRSVLGADLAIAIVLAALVLIVAPGLAVVAIIALVVIVVCAVSFALDFRRGR